MSVNRPTLRPTPPPSRWPPQGANASAGELVRVRRRQPDQRVQDVAAACEKSMPAPRWS